MNRYYQYLVFLIVLTSCASIRTTINQDPEAEMQQYESYCWIEGCDGSYQGIVNQSFSKDQLDSVKSSISKVLAEKGWQHDPNDPDVLIGFYILLEEQSVQDRLNDPFLSPYGQAIDYWKGYADYQEMNQEYYTEGTLIIDIIHAKELTAIWQSSTKRFINGLNPSREKRIQNDIKTALKDLPSVQ